MRQMKWMKKSNLNIINVDNDTDTFNNLSGQVIINHLKQDLTINNKCNIYIIDTLCENINFKMLDNSYLNVTIYMKNPNKDFFIPGDRICCQDMKKTTLENLYDALLNMQNEITLYEDIRKKALRSLENMHILGNTNKSGN